MSAQVELWSASWTQAMTDVSATGFALTNVTLRFSVTLGLGGTQLRVVLSNRFGTEPLRIGGLCVVRRGVSFTVATGQQASWEIPAGTEMTTDPVSVATEAGENLVLDLFLAEQTGLSTGNSAGCVWNPSEPGDYTGRQDFAMLPTPHVRVSEDVSFEVPAPFLRGVDVAGRQAAAVVACLGDSITAAGWPDRATALLRGAGIALLNRGISGNRLRRDSAGQAGGFFGPAGLSRFNDDVLKTAGITHAVIALGTNDLGHPGTPMAAHDEDVPTAKDLLQAIESLVERCHAAGISAAAATIMPFMGAGVYDESRDAVRREVNEGIRNHPDIDLVIDFDRAVRADAAPSSLAARYDSGDHLHPSRAGLDRLAQEAANAIRHYISPGQARGHEMSIRRVTPDASMPPITASPDD